MVAERRRLCWQTRVCAKVFRAIINPFRIAIYSTNKETKLITIEHSNCIAFHIAIYSADRQTQLITDRIRFPFS